MSSVSPLPATPADRAQAPAHARRLDRLAHDGDVAGRLEGVVGAEAAGHLEDPLDGVRAADEHVGRALAAGQLEALLGEVDADDPLGALQAAAGDGAEADHARAEDDAGRARLDLRGVDRRAEAGREAAGEQAGAVERRLGRSTLASAISGITVYSANVEVPMKWRIGSPSRTGAWCRRAGSPCSAARGSPGRGWSAG